MIALKARFDGERIVTPDELRGTPAGEVLIIMHEPPTVLTPRPSVFDLFGKAPRLRSAEEIDAQIREERDSWGDR